MIKDLVVNLTLEAARDPAAEYALSIAAAFQAHIAATAFAFDPVVTPAVLDGLSATWVDVQRDESRAAAKAAIARFEAAAERDGLSFEHRLFETSRRANSTTNTTTTHKISLPMGARVRGPCRD